MPANRFGPEIILADLGGANPITLQTENAPYPIPDPQAEYQVEVSRMRRGSDGVGVRTFQIDGADVSDQDLEFSVKLLTESQAANLEAKYYAQPARKLQISMDGGASWKAAVFQARGWEPSRWTSDWTKRSGIIRLHVTGAL